MWMVQLKNFLLKVLKECKIFLLTTVLVRLHFTKKKKKTTFHSVRNLAAELRYTVNVNTHQISKT